MDFLSSVRYSLRGYTTSSRSFSTWIAERVNHTSASENRHTPGRWHNPSSASLSSPRARRNFHLHPHISFVQLSPRKTRDYSLSTNCEYLNVNVVDPPWNTNDFLLLIVPTLMIECTYLFAIIGISLCASITKICDRKDPCFPYFYTLVIKLLFSVNTVLLELLIIHSFLFSHHSFKSRDKRSNKKLKKLPLSASKAPKSIDKSIYKSIY